MSGLFRRLSSRRSEGPEGNEPHAAADPGAADLPASNPAEESGHRSLLTDPAAPLRVTSGEAAAAGGHDPATGYVPTHAPHGPADGVPGGGDPASGPVPAHDSAASPSDATRVMPGAPDTNRLVSGDPLASPAPFAPAGASADPAQPVAAPSAVGPAYPAQPAAPPVAGMPAGPAPAYQAQPVAAPVPGMPAGPVAAPMPGAYPGFAVPGQPVEVVPVADLPAGLDPDELAARPVTSARRSKLRRRAAFLRAAREVLLRDLGGFIYELHRTAHDIEHEAHRRLRETKLARLGRVDAELHEIEVRLDDVRRQVLVREPGIGGECPECTELFGTSAHFCWNCGLPLTESARKTVARAAEPVPAPDPVIAPDPVVASDPVIAPAPVVAPAIAGVDQPTQEISPLDPEHPSAEADFRWPRRDASSPAAVAAGAPAPVDDSPATEATTPMDDTPHAEGPGERTSGEPATPDKDAEPAEGATGDAPVAYAAPSELHAEPTTSDAGDHAVADEAPHADASSEPSTSDLARGPHTAADEAPHADMTSTGDVAPGPHAVADAASEPSTSDLARGPHPVADEAPHADAASESSTGDLAPGPHATPQATDGGEPAAVASAADVPARDDAQEPDLDAEFPPRTSPDQAADPGLTRDADLPVEAGHEALRPREDVSEAAARNDEVGAEDGDAPRNGSVFSPVEQRP